jgi:hypothetical protein
MKYLKIENNKGHFLKKSEDETTFWAEIDQITKDDLFYLLNKAVTEDFELEVYKEETLSNKAHQIIYKNLSEKFVDLLLNKSRFKDESENLYKAALEKYTVNQ